MINMMNRRKSLQIMSLGSLTLMAERIRGVSRDLPPAARKLPQCVVTPQQTEGPYFVDEHLHRSDIRTDPTDGSMVEGLPLQLELKISEVRGNRCRPLPNAAVDIWHCNADGFYSDVRDPHFNTQGKQFLRGYQITDADGMARFTTIYPGWYPGRTVHIHFKIRSQPAPRQYREFTSQLYFDDAVTDQVFSQPPYSGRGGRMVRNDQDGIFGRSGKKLLLTLAENDQGMMGKMEIGMQMSTQRF